MIAQASMFCTYTHELDQYLSGLCPRGLQGTWAEWSHRNGDETWGQASFSHFDGYWASFGHYWSHSYSWAEHPSLNPGG